MLLEARISIQRVVDGLDDYKPDEPHDDTDDGILHRPFGVAHPVFVSRRREIDNTGNEKAQDSDDSKKFQQPNQDIRDYFPH